jgi:hypothetical protein
LDDILIKREKCQLQPLYAAPQIQTPKLINCGFEKTYCQWNNDTKNTQLNWTMYDVTNPTSDKAPDIGAGYTMGFLYIKALNAKLGSLIYELRVYIDHHNIDIS